MTSRLVGIDLGTTNSVVAFVDETGTAHAISDENGARILPSAVWFPGDDHGKVEIGDLAKRHRVIEPDAVATLFKRGMGRETFLDSGEAFVAHGKPWRPEELSSLIIKKLVATAAHHLGEPVTDVVVTVPAYFGEAERAATRLAGELAGLTVHLLPAEPMAAAVAHGLESPGGAATIVVFDLGGGTFDVTVLSKAADGSLAAIAHDGDRKLGGADFDALIVNDMTAQAGSEHGVDLGADANDLAEAYAAAEELKKELSTRDAAETTLIVAGKRMRYSLTRSHFESMLAGHVENTELTVETALDTAGVDKSRVDEILLVGGSSRIPAFRQMLTNYFGKEPISSKNLDEDVARGAALMGVLHLGIAPPDSALSRLSAPADRTSHAIGVVIVNDEGVEINDVVLPANSPMPTPPGDESATKRFGCASEQQTAIELIVNEGDDTSLRFVERLGTAVGEFDSPRPRGYPIDVRMAVTADGLLVAEAFDGETERLITKVEVERKGAMNQMQRAQSEAALDDVVVV